MGEKTAKSHLTRASIATAHKASVFVWLASSHFHTKTATMCTAHVAGVIRINVVISVHIENGVNQQ
ncbi:hypothetical protein AB833_02010 [Chromatiales bacterium (ex Bugula neritina AB1)]|nr:hypothetical protein AB833_02010 [Chromatiales bacterium (ex Bugula neritina AB1)]